MVQIKEGKHVYRALEAHTTLYLALYQLYIEKFLEVNPTIEKELREGVVNAITDVSKYQKEAEARLKENHKNLMEIFQTLDFELLQQKFNESLIHQAKFYNNYMTMFESLLLFIRASREQSWQLHLTSLHSLCPYFFAYDMVNYARMKPVYLSQMFAMQQNDEATWKLMEDGYFSVNKSKVPFSAIGSDHGLEQENRKLKVVGDIKGIANSQKALDKYFLTAGEMSNIVTKFCETFKIADGKEKQDEHHEILGSKNERITSNVEKITAVFETHGVTFDRVDNVFNILTKKVLPNKDAQRFLDAKAIGQAKYDKFVKDKLTGQESIWDTMTKEKLSTFAANNKTVKVTLERQIVHIREERKLMTRLLIASRSRPDIDLKKYLGIYEFSVVPRSLFTPDGSLHYTKDKAIIATELRALHQGSNEMETDEVESGNAPRKAIVIP